MFFITLCVIITLVSSGCTGNEDLGFVIKETQPDIKITTSNIETGWDINNGIIATVELTLTNYGDANGIVTVEYVGSLSGSLGQKTIFVPAQESVNDNTRLDISISDENLSYLVINQIKA